MRAGRRSTLLLLPSAVEEDVSYIREKAGFYRLHTLWRENPIIPKVDLWIQLGSSIAALGTVDEAWESDFYSTSLHVFRDCLPSERVEVSVECGTGIFPDVVL